MFIDFVHNFQEGMKFVCVILCLLKDVLRVYLRMLFLVNTVFCPHCILL